MRDALGPWWLVAGLVLSACAEESLIDGRFTEAEWKKINRFSPLPPPPPSPTNKHADDPRVAELGQRLWFERRYAGTILDGSPDQGGLGVPGDAQKVACADCHDPERWFTDTRSLPNRTSLGTSWTRRNTPSVVNAVFYQWGNWAGANDQLWKQGANLPEAREVFNSDRLRYAHVIYTYYRDHYNALFDPDLPSALDPAAPDASRFPPSGRPRTDGTVGPWEQMHPDDQLAVNTIMASCGKALEAYERLLVSGDSPFDRYVAGDLDALSPSAKRGLELFIDKAACATCHTDETFTDQDFHNTGVPQAALTDLDPGNDMNVDHGRYSDVTRLENPFNGEGAFSDDRMAGKQKLASIPTAQAESMRGQFRTKSLRHLTETGPYFHDGSAGSLLDVVRLYNRGGGPEGSYPGVKDERIRPLNLSESEMADLVAFLQSLTGRPIPASLTRNTSATAPVTP